MHTIFTKISLNNIITLKAKRLQQGVTAATTNISEISTLVRGSYSAYFSQKDRKKDQKGNRESESERENKYEKKYIANVKQLEA